MKHRSIKTLAGLTVLASAVVSGCGGKAAPEILPSSAGTESASEVAAAGVVGSIISSDTLAGGFVYRPVRPASGAFAELVARLLAPRAMASFACPAAPYGRAATGTVSGRTVTLNYSDCAPFGDPEARWSGSQILTFDSIVGRTAYASGTLSSGYVTRSFGGGIGSTPGVLVPNLPTYRSGNNGTFVYMVSNVADVICYANAAGCEPSHGPSGANAPASDYGVTTQFTNVTTRIVTINGLRMVGAVSLSDTIPSWDFTLLSGPIAVKGYGTQKSITTGTVTLFNNRQKYTATVTLTNLAWKGTTCYPTSGEVRTTCKPGSAKKEETLSYNGTSQATLLDCEGNASYVSLQCN